jgi:hypothetical protein
MLAGEFTDPIEAIKFGVGHDAAGAGLIKKDRPLDRSRRERVGRAKLVLRAASFSDRPNRNHCLRKIN